MNPELLRTIRTLAICAAIILVGYWLKDALGKKEQPPATIQTETRWIPTGRDTIVINNKTVVYPAQGVAVSSRAGITAEQVDSVLREYFARVRHDTIIEDSLSKESLSIEIERNRLNRIIRSLEVKQRETVIRIPDKPRNAFYAGVFTCVGNNQTALGPQVSFISHKGYSFSVGKDLLSNGYSGGFQIRLTK